MTPLIVAASVLIVAGLLGLVASVLVRSRRPRQALAPHDDVRDESRPLALALPQLGDDPDASGPRKPLVLASGFDDDEWSVTFETFSVVGTGRSDPGRVRPNNEDAFLCQARDLVYAVADGMGGEAAGEVASKAAIESVAAAMTEHPSSAEGVPNVRISRRGAQLVEAIVEANRQLRERIAQDGSLRGMGTTIVVLKFSPPTNRVYVAHVGDSRAYQIRRGELKQLTKDHTYGEMAGARGGLASRLAWALGVGKQVNVEIQALQPEPGDKYLLCSDGLTKMLRDDELLEIVMAEPDLERCVDRLIETANERGGVDNVTAVLVSVTLPETLDPTSAREREKSAGG